MAVGDLINLATRAGDSRMWTVEQMLADAQKDAQIKLFNKAIVLMLDDTDGGYEYCYLQAGMTFSDILALLQVAEHYFADKLMHAE